MATAGRHAAVSLTCTVVGRRHVIEDEGDVAGVTGPGDEHEQAATVGGARTWRQQPKK